MLENQEHLTDHQEMPQVTEETVGVSNQESVANSEIKELAANVTELISLVKIENRKDEINKELHEELQTYKSGLMRETMSPLLKNLIHWHGKVTDLFNFYDKKQQEENADLVALFPVLLKEYKNLAGGLEDLLYDYDIEQEVPAVGGEFNPRTQKSLRIVETEDDTLDRKIAECINTGFRDTATGRLLKQSEVAVYQKKS
jgi:molecular chaperone GrpE